MKIISTATIINIINNNKQSHISLSQSKHSIAKYIFEYREFTFISLRTECFALRKLIGVNMI